MTASPQPSYKLVPRMPIRRDYWFLGIPGKGRGGSWKEQGILSKHLKRGMKDGFCAVFLKTWELDRILRSLESASLSHQMWHLAFEFCSVPGICVIGPGVFITNNLLFSGRLGLGLLPWEVKIRYQIYSSTIVILGYFLYQRISSILCPLLTSSLLPF